jgi:hypothetical protein
MGTITITQVYFTFNLFSMVLLMLLDMRRTLAKVAVVLSLFACMLAHSGHQTLFLMAAVVIVGMLQLRAKDAIKLAAFLAVLLAMMLTVSAIYWENIEGWYRKSLVDEDSPKRMVTVAAGEILSSPKNMLLGAGIGQFGSRAALITSGEYLSIPLPKMLVGESEYYREFVLPAHEEYLLYGEHSAITKPYYSALNTIVEFGLPLSLLLLGALATQFASNWRLARSTNARVRAVGVLANVGLVFLLLCCLIENYLEFPQAIFLPTLLYVAARTLKGEAE